MNPSPPLLATALAEDLAEGRAATGERPTAARTLLRGSDAWRCSRQVAFGALRVPRSVALGTETLMAFDAGQHHHTRLQGVLAKRFGAELEVPVSYKEVGIDLSGHADAVYEEAQIRRVVEIKSMKAYPFLRATGGTDRFGRNIVPEGPKTDHLVQAGIYANAPQVRAQEVHMAYINKEDGAVGEWLVPMVGEPVGPGGEDLVALVERELERLSGVARDVEAGYLPWRRIPGFGLVKHPPAEGTRDEPWNCRYCGWQPLCALLPASRVSLSHLGPDPAGSRITLNEELW